MPRYYFHAKDVAEFRDEDGIELPDLAAAREEAVAHFGEMLQTNAGAFNGRNDWQITVTDHRGLTLLTFSFFMGMSPAAQGSLQSAGSKQAKLAAAENNLPA